MSTALSPLDFWISRRALAPGWNGKNRGLAPNGTYFNDFNKNGPFGMEFAQTNQFWFLPAELSWRSVLYVPGS
jgi:hypothetical protein